MRGSLAWEERGGGSRRTAASAFWAVRVLLWNSSLFTLNAPSLL